ncbi:bifunctional EF-hand domain pair/EF-hand domain [Babesia duncani]|uniref:Calmodulin n=1 Tax=Babesia duncani TaxID=323732 RepID=A0AAD9UNQ4_9APIC|nr:bifunctional EF-hand domain pair/EF-hand domain [Babesia duncani]
MANAEIEAMFKSYSAGKPFVLATSIDEIVRELVRLTPTNQSQGYAPSIAELEDFKRRIGTTCDLETLCEFIATIGHPEDTRENLLELFKFYDKANTGTIDKALLQTILENVGEPLNEEEIEEFFTNTCNYGDKVPYKDLVDKLIMK